MTAQERLRRRPHDLRRGLVLGGGGVLGFAWMVGALQALQDEEGFDVRDVDVVVGTSAGSVLAALIGCGVSVDAILRHQRGIPLPGDPSIGYVYDRDSGGRLPPRPAFGLGSPDLLRAVARHPRSVPPLAAMSAVLPRGRGTLSPVGRMIAGLVETALPGDAGAAEPPTEIPRPRGDGESAGVMAEPVLPGCLTTEPGVRWPTQPRTWIVALDYGGGRRVAFGREDAPSARLSDAVMASCSIPGWYTPVTIDGRRYVDGGTFSPTSLDLLAGAGLDEVWALAPMASFAYDRPRSPIARVERRYRRAMTRRVLTEAAAVREMGTAVTVLGPGPEDLAAIGANLMNPRRRLAVLTTSLRTSADALRRSSARMAGTERAAQ